MASGMAEMETVASGESLVIVIVIGEGLQAAVAVIVPEAGTAVKLDPSVPMLWVGGEQHPAFVQNAAYMKKNDAGKPFAILEYDRAAN